MIEDFFDTTYDVYRQSYGDTNTSTESVVATFDGHQQKTSSRLTEWLDLSFTDSFTIWCPLSTDVKVGDTIENGSERYSVRSEKDLDFGNNKHKRIIVEGE